MELNLARQSDDRVLVTCEGQISHTFDLRTLTLNGEASFHQPPDDPIAYGESIFRALFPPGTPARGAFDNAPISKLVLATTTDDLDALPWEYAYGPQGFLVLNCLFTRGLPLDQRIDPPILDTGLHIVAVISNPLNNQMSPFDRESEWELLKEIIEEIPSSAVTLERTYPPALEQIRRLVANQRNRVVHLIGRSGLHEGEAVFYLELDNGDSDPVNAQKFMRRLGDAVFLVTVDRPVNTAATPTNLNHFAVSLLRQKLPYALDMRFGLLGEDASNFSRTFYGQLSQGYAVEEAMLQARLILAKSTHRWAIGVPVLYTALKEVAGGFPHRMAGTSVIKEFPRRSEVSILPRTRGIFQGRISELKKLGDYLTGDSRPHLLTIYGGSGQGKTALVREAVERFAYAWPGGIWAINMANLPSREIFVSDLARFLGITDAKTDSKELELRLLDQLAHNRTLIILDNAETLVKAVEANNEATISLARFLRESLPRPPVSLLAISHSYLRWINEIGFELEGLDPIAGARLFQQSAPARAEDVDLALASNLSKEAKGNPLSLCLLGSAFNATIHPLSTIYEEFTTNLPHTENKYIWADPQNYALYRCIEISIGYLNPELRALLSKLWVFHAPFPLETAQIVFNANANDAEGENTLIDELLHVLWQRGFLEREIATVHNETILLYHLSQTIRLFLEKELEQNQRRDELLTRFGLACAHLIVALSTKVSLDVAAYLVERIREDLERGVEYIEGLDQAYCLVYLGSLLSRLGYTRHSLQLVERALGIAQGQDQKLEMVALSNKANIYNITGHPQEALVLFEQAQLLAHELSDQSSKAAILNNIAEIYLIMDQPQRALVFYEEALEIHHELADRFDQVIALNRLATIHHDLGHPQEALEFYEQVLPILREAGALMDEVATLHSMANIYSAMNQPQQALVLLERALPLLREIGNRAGEAATLNNIAGVYHNMGQLQRALTLCEQALPITREAGDRAGEATTLNNIAMTLIDLGRPHEALVVFEQVLQIKHVLNDRKGEALTLHNMASVYNIVNQPQRALMLFEQALPILREVNDKEAEAYALLNVADIYRITKQARRALEFYGQLLAIQREVSDRAGEVETLSNMALLHKEIDQPEDALASYKQLLVLQHEVGDRVGEADTLSNMAWMHFAMEQSELALTTLEQALSIFNQLGDRVSEANTLSDMAWIYYGSDQLGRALALFEQALQIHSETDDHDGEISTLEGLVYVYKDMGRYTDALTAFEQLGSLELLADHPASEAAGLVDIAFLLCEHLNSSQEAITQLEKAIVSLVEAGLFKDAEGKRVNDLLQTLEAMRTGSSFDDPGSFAIISTSSVQQIVIETVAVMTVAQDQHAKWRETIAMLLEHAQQQGGAGQSEVDFFKAILALLDGQPSKLPPDHLYMQELMSIQYSAAVSNFVNAQDWDDKRKVVETYQDILFSSDIEAFLEEKIIKARKLEDRQELEHLESRLSLLRQCKTKGIAATFELLVISQQDGDIPPFDGDLIYLSIAALLGKPQEKMAHAQYLATQESQTADEKLKALINVIQLALLGEDPSELGNELTDVYRVGWEVIVLGTEIGSSDVVAVIAQQALQAVHTGYDGWRQSLISTRNFVSTRDEYQLVALLNASKRLMRPEFVAE